MTSQTPNCGNPVSFVLGSSYAFMSLQILTSFAGVVQILSPVVADHGSHAQILTASVDAQTTPINFSIFIDMCSASVF